MNGAPFLKWYENIALWVLWRSPRVGMVAVRKFNTALIWYAEDAREDGRWAILDDCDELPVMHELERLYHMPAYGEPE